MVNNKVFPLISALIFILLSAFLTSTQVLAQTLPLPYLIKNLSEYSDSEIYVGLVGKIDNQDVWIDMATGDINEMKLSDNTLQGPIYNGNRGPGGEGMYADVFTTLDAIPDNTIDIPQIYAVRIFIAFESPLYLYFFGADADGNPGGYSAPSLSNDSDPNLGLKYELIELTYGDNGLWTNTTRVDAYQYPMGLEVWGTDGFYKRVGEVLSHDDILSQWRSNVGDAFQGSLDETMEIILNPSKSASFQEGEAYNDYFADYVDAVWARYENEDMYLSIGEAGVWRGRVTDEQFIFTNQTDETVGMISAKPNTLEILEASGVMAEDVTSTPSIHADQNIQKHFSAAFNRGAIDLDAPTDELLEWSDLNSYFGENTHNEYVAFWHNQTISFEGETYAFAYDDVFDYSSTIQSTVPERVTITIGGFVNDAYVAPESVEITEIMGGEGVNTFTISTSGIKIGLTSGNTTTLSAQLLPLNVDNPAIKWHSSDSTVATISDGLITAVDTGSAVITVSSFDDSVNTTILVEVNGGDYRNDTTQRIEAEDYSNMSGIQTQATSDNNGELNVGWIDIDDYLEYQVNIATAGEYTIAYRIASVATDGVVAPAVNLQVDGETLLSTDLNSTGGWDNWKTQTATVTLPAGDITIRLVATGANWNLNWFDITQVIEGGIDDTCQTDSDSTVSDATVSNLAYISSPTTSHFMVNSSITTYSISPSAYVDSTIADTPTIADTLTIECIKGGVDNLSVIWNNIVLGEVVSFSDSNFGTLLSGGNTVGAITIISDGNFDNWVIDNSDSDTLIIPPIDSVTLIIPPITEEALTDDVDTAQEETVTVDKTAETVIDNAQSETTQKSESGGAMGFIIFNLLVLLFYRQRSFK